MAEGVRIFMLTTLLMKTSCPIPDSYFQDRYSLSDRLIIYLSFTKLFAKCEKSDDECILVLNIFCLPAFRLPDS